MSNARSAPPFSTSAESLLTTTTFASGEASRDAANHDNAAANAPASTCAPPTADDAHALDAHALTVTISIPATSDFVRVVRLAVTGVASRMRFSYDQIEDIKLAVSEACNNAILHAMPASAHARAAQEAQPVVVVIRLTPHDDRLEIVIADQGVLEPPGLTLQTPDATAQMSAQTATESEINPDELPESGMGLMLMQSLMDEVTTQSGGRHTAVHMVKHLRPL